MIDDEGCVTEGGSSNAWILRNNKLITRQADNTILRGVTRTAIIALLDSHNVTLEERAFTPEEARSADEAFFTSATSLITPVVEIDGHRIGTGSAGPLTCALFNHYRSYVRKEKNEDDIRWSA